MHVRRASLFMAKSRCAFGLKKLNMVKFFSRSSACLGRVSHTFLYVPCSHRCVEYALNAFGARFSNECTLYARSEFTRYCCSNVPQACIV